ncbi:MAG: hypothetical protein EXS05_04670 [Planctomycetaceae bacterium]|nr:hypothetical protein [Planctomycetaceae bacterium]
MSAIFLGLALGPSLVLPVPEALARGGTGLSWGYHPPAGNPFSNLWREAGFWSQASGGGIPNRSLAAPNLNAGPSVGGSSMPGRVSGLRQGGGGFQSGSVGRGSSNRSSQQGGPRFQTVPRLSSGGGGGRSERPSPPRSETGDEVPVYDPPYHNSYNNYWHLGYWGGGMSGWARWGGELGIWGFPRWSIGPIYYASGYGHYQNPFLDPPTGQVSSVTDYSKPIQLAADQAANEASTAAGAGNDAARQSTYDERLARILRSPQAAAGMKSFDAAREAFQSRDFDQASKQVNAALGELPRDPALHEFRALVQFARGEYLESAAAIYAVLSVAPGWNWSTLSGLYADQADYTQQLRSLEVYSKAHRDEAAPAFLLAYQYVTCRHVPSAVKQLERVIKLLPGDELSAQLLTLISNADESGTEAVADGGPAGPASDTGAAETAARPVPTTIDSARMIGQWRTVRSSQITIDLSLRDDHKFVWVATENGKPYRFEGRYTITEDLLILAGIGRVMVGTVTLREPAGFNFQLLEPNSADNGLDFGK